MHLVKDAEKKRIRFVEERFEEVKKTLGDPRIRIALGHKACELDTLAKQIFIPNIRHGKVTIPSEYMDTDYVPVVPVKHHRELRLGSDFIHLTPRQRASAATALKIYGTDPDPFLEGIERGFGDIETPVKLLTGRAAISWRSRGSRGNKFFEQFENDAELYSMLRPIILLGRHAVHPPSVLIHELVHVDQIFDTDAIATLDHPFYSQENAESREYEAYYYGARVEQYEDGGNALQQKIEAARVELADSEDPFASSPALRERVAQLNINMYI